MKTLELKLKLYIAENGLNEEIYDVLINYSSLDEKGELVIDWEKFYLSIKDVIDFGIDKFTEGLKELLKSIANELVNMKLGGTIIPNNNKGEWIFRDENYKKTNPFNQDKEKVDKILSELNKSVEDIRKN